MRRGRMALLRVLGSCWCERCCEGACQGWAAARGAGKRARVDEIRVALFRARSKSLTHLGGEVRQKSRCLCCR